jgi:hypothetical protein
MQSIVNRTILAVVFTTFPAVSTFAATIDGIFGGINEYSYNTEAAPNSKHNTHGGPANSEFNDGSGGDPWNINYLGTDIDRSGAAPSFQFGVFGGCILSGQNLFVSQDLFLSVIAINVVTDLESPTDPTHDSTGWDYAVRLLSLTDTGLGGGQMQADFELFEFVENQSSWVGRNIYNRNPDGSQGHVTETFEMLNGDSRGTFSGFYTDNGADNNVLEGSFDMGLLSLYNEADGGKIITYITMSCVNDEAIVHADISPEFSSVPIPAGIWLFGSALVGLVGFNKRKNSA